MFVVRFDVVDDHVHAGRVRAERRRRGNAELGRYPVQVDDAFSGSNLGVHGLSAPITGDTSFAKAEGAHQPVMRPRNVLVDENRDGQSHLSLSEHPPDGTSSTEAGV